MHLILHIGTEKTGTTSIQDFLSLNRPELFEHRIFIPETLGATNQRLLAGIAMQDDRLDDLFQATGLQDAQARKAAKARWRDQFHQELEKNRENIDTVIISSEHLQSRLSSEEEIERLHSILSGLFESIEVLVYLREPIATAVSAYSTAVKYGAQSANIPPPTRPYFFNLVNHARTIRRWTKVFGAESVRVRLFEPDALEGGEAVTDFVKTTGLPQLGHAAPLRRNPSLDALGVELLRRINQKVPRFIDGKPNPQREGLVEFFEAHFSNGPPIVPSQSDIEAYEAAFSESNEYVRSTYFPDRERLFTPYSRVKSVTEHTQQKDYDVIAAALAHLWSKKADAEAEQDNVASTEDIAR